MATPANQSSLNGASNGFVSTVEQGFTSLFSLAKDASIKYLQDQWGLSTSGNGVDQKIFQNQNFQQAGTTTTGARTQNALFDNPSINISPNTVLILAVVGVGLYLAFRG